MPKTLQVAFNNRLLHIRYYNHKYQGTFWVFDTGHQVTLVNEADLCRFLDISPETARKWRSRKLPHNNALLYLAWQHFTGAMMPPEWARAGFYFKGGTLNRGDTKTTLQEAKITRQLLSWHLKQANQALEALLRKERTRFKVLEAVAPARKNRVTLI